jgi:aspergillopepsin I
MPSFTYLTAALALTGAVVATPVQKRDAFSVEQVKHNIHLKNGPGQVAKTLRKYGKVVPQHIQAAADNRANVSLKHFLFYRTLLTLVDRHCSCYNWL